MRRENQKSRTFETLKLLYHLSLITKKHNHDYLQSLRVTITSSPSVLYSRIDISRLVVAALMNGAVSTSCMCTFALSLGDHSWRTYCLLLTRDRTLLPRGDSADQEAAPGSLISPDLPGHCLSISLYADALTPGALPTWRDCPSQGWPIPRDSKWLTCKHTFHMRANQYRAHSRPPPLLGSHTLGNDPPALTPLGSRARQLERAPTARSPPKLFKLANPVPAYSAASVPSHGNHDKGSCPCPFSVILPPELPNASHMALHGVAWPLPLGTVSDMPSFQWQSSDRLASPYLNNNKIYILK